jgi:enterochelin esterase-like enzyme
MYRWIIVVTVALCATRAAADPLQSPRIAALAARPWTAPELWKQLETEGTPMIEDVHDPKGRLLVTFVYRARPGLEHVAVYHVPSFEGAGYARLERIAGTDVFAWSCFIEPTARLTYNFAPDDDFGPPPNRDDPAAAKRGLHLRPDPLNPHFVPGMRSLVELPRAPAQPWLVAHRESAPGSVVQHEVKSKALGNSRTVWIYTPPGFSMQGAPYPLVVTFDGGAMIGDMGLALTLDNLIATKRIPPCVVAMVGNAVRERELPHNAAFADFIALDLVPWVRRTYHASDDPLLTVITGLSYGGTAAAFAAFRHAEVYGNVLSQSGSYWYTDDDWPGGEQHAREYFDHARLPLRFWMEVGLYEGSGPFVSMLSSNRHLHDVLVARGYDVSYREFAGEHEVINWRGSIADGLLALLATPPQFTTTPPPSVGTPGGIEVGPAKPAPLAAAMRTSVLDGPDAAVAWLKQQAPGDVTDDVLNDLGDWAMSRARPVDAVTLYGFYAERFPTSANAFDDLAEAYYRSGDRAHAISTYQHALALDPKDVNARKYLEMLR